MIKSTLAKSAETVHAPQTRESIQLLSHSDLVNRIIAAQLPFLRDADHQRLPSLDRETLERLMYLARDYVRNNPTIAPRF